MTAIPVEREVSTTLDERRRGRLRALLRQVERDGARLQFWATAAALGVVGAVVTAIFPWDARYLYTLGMEFVMLAIAFVNYRLALQEPVAALGGLRDRNAPDRPADDLPHRAQSFRGCRPSFRHGAAGGRLPLPHHAHLPCRADAFGQACAVARLRGGAGLEPCGAVGGDPAGHDHRARHAARPGPRSAPVSLLQPELRRCHRSVRERRGDAHHRRHPRGDRGALQPPRRKLYDRRAGAFQSGAALLAEHGRRTGHSGLPVRSGPAPGHRGDLRRYRGVHELHGRA